MAKQQKSLQKLTDSNGSANAKVLTQPVGQWHSERPDEVTPAQERARIDAIVNSYLENPLVPEEQKEDLRNQTWQGNHGELTRVIGNLINDTGRMPTVNQLAEQTGMSRQTIHKHLKDFYQSDRYQTQLHQFRMLSDRVLANLYKLAIEGDVRASKVFLDVVGGMPIRTTEPTENTNYIQVNNNIKIDQVTFAMLPESVQQQITGLILQGLQVKIQQDDNP